MSTATMTLQEANEERLEAYGTLHEIEAEAARAEKRYFAVYLIHLFADNPDIELIEGTGESDGDATCFTVSVGLVSGDDLPPGSRLDEIDEFLNQFYPDVESDGWMDELRVTRADVARAQGNPDALIPVLLNGGVS